MKWRFGFENSAPIDEVPENAPEGVRRAIRGYYEVVSTDIGAVLETDRKVRQERFDAAKAGLANVQRLRQEEDLRFEDARLELERVRKGKSETQNEVDGSDKTRPQSARSENT